MSRSIRWARHVARTGRMMCNIWGGGDSSEIQTFHLSCLRGQQIYRIQNLPPLGHPVTESMLRDDFEGMICGWDYDIKSNVGGTGCGIDRIHISQSRFET